MSKKIEVSQELLEQIIDCYVNKQLSIEKTIHKLKLPFGKNPLKRILKENNVRIRTYKEAHNIGIRAPIEKDVVNEIIKLYNNGYSIERIQRELIQYFSTYKIKKILMDNNVSLRTLEESKETKIQFEERKFPVFDDYCLESHNGAWLLGFIAADGYLPVTRGAKNRIIISLAEKDKEILERIAKEIKYEGEIKKYLASDEKHYFVSLAFTSKKIRQKIEDYGITNDKTFKLQHLPNIPKEYMIDFIRGFFDGDGSVYAIDRPTSPLRISITCASNEFLEEIAIFLEQNLGVAHKNLNRDHNNYCIAYGHKDSKKICDAFYNNDSISLKRKKDKYYEIINSTRLNIPKE
ncbi:MAG: LAGLIDADG-like domain protein [Caudoviricetes sp.]|nr:MAG: LAGLIDADG-like domain protein [Caudoviricetes sp.]